MISATFSACGNTYTGKVAVKGHEPFICLVLVTGTGDLKIVGAMRQRLWDSFQGKRITVKGTIVKEGKGFMILPELEVTEIVWEE